MSISSTKNNEKENIKISSPIIINNGDSSSFSTEKFQRTTSDKNKKMVKKFKNTVGSFYKIPPMIWKKY